METDRGPLVEPPAVKATIVALLLGAALPAAAAPRPAGSAPGPGGRSLSLWGVVDPGPIDGVGAGMRLTLPIVPEGMLHGASVRDELVLEVGADFVHYSAEVGFYPYFVDYSWNGLLAVGGVAWNFWLTPRFAVYPKLDLGWWFGWYDGWDDRYGYGRRDFDGAFLQGAVGLAWRLRSAAFRLELGTDLVRIGVAFSI
jgi:hypothetical protein